MNLVNLLPAALLLVLHSPLHAQMPQLKVDGKEHNGVTLQTLSVSTQIAGAVATTSWTMTFRNHTDRVLEGELTFPLAEGISISSYALDIDGRMRDAVPVDKAKGTAVFETIERRKVDPGLLEKVDGNAFRTRIYPINPGATRTVRIGYDEILTPGSDCALQYRVPLSFTTIIDTVNLDISVLQSSKTPVFTSNPGEAFSFRQSGKNYSASHRFVRYRADVPLHISIPKQREHAEVTMQASGNQYYFLLQMFPKSGQPLPKPLPAQLTLLWDASLSRLQRDSAKEEALLDAYFRNFRQLKVTLVVFSHTVQSRREYVIRNGDWRSLKKALRSVVYDGGTQLGCLDLKTIPGAEFLLFSDGRSGYGKEALKTDKRPVYCITSTTGTNYPALRWIAEQSGGALLDLNTSDTRQALQQLQYQPLRFLGIKNPGVATEVYPSRHVAVSGTLSLSGKVRNPHQELVLQFGYGTKVTTEQKVLLHYSHDNSNTNTERMWAKQKIAELDLRYEQNKSIIGQLGKRYGIVTRNTSLIVLETLEDYIQYGIEPPAELRKDYALAVKERNRERREELADAQENALDDATVAMKELRAWWGVPRVPVPEKKKTTAQTTLPPPPPVATSQNGAGEVYGIVTNDKREPVVNVPVQITEGGIVKGNTATDIDGRFSFRPLSPGYYRARVSHTGYKTSIIDSIWVDGLGVRLDVKLEAASTSLREVEVKSMRYSAPERAQIDLGPATTLSPEQIRKLPVRNTTDMHSMVPGTYQRQAGSVNIGGGRTENTIVVIDGVQVSRQALNANSNATRFITTYVGANSARYGNTSGGVIVASTGTEEKTSGTFITSDFSPAMIDSILQAPPAKKYEVYLQQRKQYLHDPLFYFHAAAIFLKAGKKDLSLQVLSNLTELELEDHELYKMLGYRLKELGAWEEEVRVFRKVLQWRPFEPQSYRDYALALEDAGQLQAAFDTLFSALTQTYPYDAEEMYEGMEDILLMELNNLIARHPGGIQTQKFPKKLIARLPTDIRVVLNWNHSDTDIDLWVTDPNNEKCYYGHNATDIGGRISDDFTNGYGPEQFLLKKAIPGAYKIEVDYFDDRQASVSGPVTVMAEVYTYYGTPRQKRQIICLQMVEEEKGDGGAVYVGEFRFK